MDKILLNERLDKTIKVVFFTHYSLLYGANRSLLNLIDGLGDYPIRPYVIVPDAGDMTQALEERGIEFAIFSMERWIGQLALDGSPIERLKAWSNHQKSAFRRIKNNLKRSGEILKKVKEWEADIIYTNSSVLPVGALVAYRANLPHVWHLREFVDLDYGLRFDWGKVITKAIINRSSAKIAISNAIYSHFSGQDSRDYSIIYNGIARQTEFDGLRRQGNNHHQLEPSSPYTFCLIGKISPGKGQDIAIQALSLLQQKYSNTRLLVVGGGDDELIKQLTAQLNLDHCVEFWGQIANPYDAYFASDAVLMCSKSEGMGRVTVEAMSACRPVIGYDNAGTSEVIAHCETGLLYKGNAVELSAAMEQLILRPELGRKLAIAGWESARKKYCVEVYAERVYEVLIKALARKDGTPLLAQPDPVEVLMS